MSDKGYPNIQNIKRTHTNQPFTKKKINPINNGKKT